MIRPSYRSALPRRSYRRVVTVFGRASGRDFLHLARQGAPKAVGACYVRILHLKVGRRRASQRQRQGPHPSAQVGFRAVHPMDCHPVDFLASQINFPTRLEGSRQRS